MADRKCVCGGRDGPGGSAGLFGILDVTSVEKKIMQPALFNRYKKQRYDLVGEICPHCEGAIFPPRDVCPFCGGESPAPRMNNAVPTVTKKYLEDREKKLGMRK